MDILQTLRRGAIHILLRLCERASSLLLSFRARLQYQPSDSNRSQPVLCFGDSITEGYHNIWPHEGVASHRKPAADMNANEHKQLLCHPYAIRLGQLLAADVCDGAGGYKDSLRYARARGYSGWTAQELLPVLRRALREGPWRCVVIMAGANDVLWEGASARTVLARLDELYEACDEAGVPVVALTNIELDFAELLSSGILPDEAARVERTETLAAVAGGVMQIKGRRVVADARAALPFGAAFFDDAIHPSAAGSDRLGEVVFRAIKGHGL